MELTETEMQKINGGISWYVIGGIGAVLAYLIGVLSGFTNPSQCNN